jgi:two-component system sensor histidine kinase DegS
METNNLKNYDLPLNLLEDERSRIAKELHDSTIQDLVHAIHQIEMISHYMENDLISARLELSLLSQNLKEAINNTRNLIYDLKPMAIEDLGFFGALDDYFTYLKTFSKIHFSYSIHNDLDHLADKELLTLFRIIQEACINAIKHSEATELKITISEYNQKYYKIAIDDNGRGCKEENLHQQNHYGLEILKERVKLVLGECKIKTGLNEGFHVTVILPMTC